MAPVPPDNPTRADAAAQRPTRTPRKRAADPGHGPARPTRQERGSPWKCPRCGTRKRLRGDRNR